MVELLQIGFMGCQQIMNFLQWEKSLMCADRGDQIMIFETKAMKNVKCNVFGRQRCIDDGKFIDGALDIMKVSSNQSITSLKKGEMLLELHHTGSRLVCIQAIESHLGITGSFCRGDERHDRISDRGKDAIEKELILLKQDGVVHKICIISWMSWLRRTWMSSIQESHKVIAKK